MNRVTQVTYNRMVVSMAGPTRTSTASSALPTPGGGTSCGAERRLAQAASSARTIECFRAPAPCGIVRADPLRRELCCHDVADGPITRPAGAGDEPCGTLAFPGYGGRTATAVLRRVVVAAIHPAL